MESTTTQSLAGRHVNVALVTGGGLCPTLSSCVAKLVEHWAQALREGKIGGLSFRVYRSGFMGVLVGDSFLLPESEWNSVESLNKLGGSPCGNSRVRVSVRQLASVSYFEACEPLGS